MNKQTIQRDALEKYLASILDINRFRDYCPNGLQVEGRPDIRTLVTGVTASRALIEAAIELDADAIMVHHGYFWRNEDPRVLGPKHRRLKMLLSHEINLFAYHLPLDMHPELGNNAQLAKILQLEADGRFGENDIGWMGTATEIATVGELAASIEKSLGRKPLVIGDASQKIGRIGWCTGAAQNYLADAVAAGASTYLSGEISEPTVHLARETGVAYISCGHHATERYGVKALGEHVSSEFCIVHYFVDIDNPV
ncbi:Nif3-like dinuclear metal center hexameric protein [Oxalobacteraceae bacterium R-40]|uniref:Nif3-like dinuclear metal center hexameric protein n=1 Tax=Keguizhuia sedimenti TaxID=3064264 RepID=A0ABU1BQ89_9BURK|nr:Nif3-like dinuclear metal center hexameric protein [Oxalobacteraceae bacterium R-40]